MDFGNIYRCEGKVDNMFVIKNEMRYEILANQFNFPSDKAFYYDSELHHSLERIFSYLFHFTDVYYIEYIDENQLYSYIEHHGKTNFKTVSFVEALRDIKSFLNFSKYTKGLKKVPEINLSLNNFPLWTKL